MVREETDEEKEFWKGEISLSPKMQKELDTMTKDQIRAMWHSEVVDLHKEAAKSLAHYFGDTNSNIIDIAVEAYKETTKHFEHLADWNKEDYYAIMDEKIDELVKKYNKEGYI